MPLHLEATDREIVVSEIAKALNGVPTPSAFFVPYLGNEVVAKMPEEGARDRWARAGLLKAEEADYRDDNTHPLLELLNALGRTHAGILQIALRLQGLPRPLDPLTAFVLDNGQAFLDRDSFRSKIAKLLSPRGPVVLRVVGGPKSGKWYSYKFLMFLSLSGKQIVPISFQCGPTTSVLTLAQSLLQRMGTSDWQQRPYSDESAAKEAPLRVGQSVADWFLNAALRSQQNWWFFIKFTDSSIPADTKEFIRQLAVLFATTPAARNSLRLVLLNFVDEFPPDLRRLQEREEIKLDRTAWETYIQGYILHLKSGVSAEKHTDLDGAQQDILMEIRAAKDEEFLATLCKEVENLTDELRTT
jgi:hypothetical protein